MTSDMIEKFVENKTRKGSTVNIHFKDRNTVKGFFIHGGDYDEMKSKNFWRIVSSNHVEEWEKTGDINLARLYNGMSFTRLSEDQG